MHSLVSFCILHPSRIFYIFFFFNDTATTEIYTLSLHDALPISQLGLLRNLTAGEIVEQIIFVLNDAYGEGVPTPRGTNRSEEHTSELQSRFDLVCRLLLEKKKKKKNHIQTMKCKNTKI